MTPLDLYSLDRDPTFSELKSAFTGHVRQERQRVESMRDMMYGAARFNAGATAFSKEQSRAVSRHRFPWETQVKREPMAPKKVIGILSLISKN